VSNALLSPGSTLPDYSWSQLATQFFSPAAAKVGFIDTVTVDALLAAYAKVDAAGSL